MTIYQNETRDLGEIIKSEFTAGTMHLTMYLSAHEPGNPYHWDDLVLLPPYGSLTIQATEYKRKYIQSKSAEEVD